jgi:Phosphoesterase family
MKKFTRERVVPIISARVSCVISEIKVPVHPPHDVRAGEQFLVDIWNAVSQSPKWKEILLIITYDEHGGTYDHVLPPTGAAVPDQASNPGPNGFRFDRFGVRVPTISLPTPSSGMHRSDPRTPKARH